MYYAASKCHLIPSNKVMRVRKRHLLRHLMRPIHSKDIKNHPFSAIIGIQGHLWSGRMANFVRSFEWVGRWRCCFWPSWLYLATELCQLVSGGAKVNTKLKLLATYKNRFWFFFHLLSGQDRDLVMKALVFKVWP